MAEDGSQQRKPDFRTAVADVKALGTVLLRTSYLRSPAGLAAIGVVATLVLALGVVMALLQTGNVNAVSDNAALIGALVALGGVFTAQMVSIALDYRRTQEARDLEAQRAGEAALQNYFETVGELLIEKPLHRASPGDNLSTVVRAQTLAVLEGLDPAHKRILLRFLYESVLIDKDKPVVSLVFANLRDADLRRTFLHGANLRGADLSYADLREAYLGYADLSKADLRGGVVRVQLSEADLGDAYLGDANLSDADLSRAYLSGAYLRGAYLRGADLSEADLSGADLSDEASLREADLAYAHLSGADLRKSDLSDADLSGADLSDAYLRGADLSGANLRGAMGISNEELEHQALTLEGATMPNGSEHP